MFELEKIQEAGSSDHNAGSRAEELDEHSRAEIVRQAIDAEEKYALQLKRLNKEMDELRKKMEIAETKLKDAKFGHQQTRSSIFSRLPELKKLHSSMDAPEFSIKALKSYLDNGSRWPALLSGEVPDGYIKAFLKGEARLPELHECGPYEGLPKGYSVEIEGNQVLLVKYIRANDTAVMDKYSEIVRLPQVRKVVEKRDIDQ